MAVNMNGETGLPYGVISGRSLDPEILAELYDKALAIEFDAAYEAERVRLAESVGVGSLEYEASLEEFCDFFELGDPHVAFEFEGVNLVFTTLGGAPLVISTDGPSCFVESYCSPCVPNAADLDSGRGMIECHGIPDAWLASEEV